MYGHTYSKSKDQPGKVANPAPGQLNREINISLSAFAPENLVYTTVQRNVLLVEREPPAKRAWYIIYYITYCII